MAKHGANTDFVNAKKSDKIVTHGRLVIGPAHRLLGFPPRPVQVDNTYFHV